MAMSMNSDIKAQWLADLRSGEFQQGHNYLNQDGKLCCLGVLCEQAVRAGIITKRPSDNDPSTMLYGDEDAEKDDVLPTAVQEWAGLDASNPHIDPEGFEVTWDTEPDNPGGGYLIANANDGGTTFAVIADIIDAQL